MKIDPKKVPVMKNYCTTCPFKPNDFGKWQDMTLANQVITRTLFKAHQICHGTEKEDRTPTHRCKGAYDYNLEIYKKLGLDDLVE